MSSAIPLSSTVQCVTLFGVEITEEVAAELRRVLLKPGGVLLTYFRSSTPQYVARCEELLQCSQRRHVQAALDASALDPDWLEFIAN
jgi:hypothetical protein